MNLTGNQILCGLRLGLALAGMLVLAGCNNNPHPATWAETHPKDPAVLEAKASGKPWVVSYRALPDDPKTLDPQVSYDTLGHSVLAQTYESLLEYNPFKTNPYELEPCLAESMPTKVQNPDGTEAYEVHLKRGIRFQDDPCFPGGKGREVVAADFDYAFQRIADPKVECPVLSTLQEFIKGLGPAFMAARKAGKFDYTKPTGALTIIDDHTFRINLLKPYPQLMYWLAMEFTAPVPREAVEYYTGQGGRDQFKFHPVGTGPYRVAEWSRSRLIRLVRNDHYTTTHFPTAGWHPTENALFKPLAGRALPFVDEVQLPIIREAIPGWLLFRQGYLDRSGISKDVFNSVVTQGNTLTEKYRQRGVQLFRDVEPSTYYITFNMEDPVVGKNKKLRQAISTAYNETKANEIFRNSVDLKAEQLLPPGVIGHEDDFNNPYRTENLEQARRLLAEAGYPNGIDPKTGKPLVLTLDAIADESAARQQAEFDKSQIEQLGIVCHIEADNWARFQEKQQRGQFQMNSGSGWDADYPDPENFFFLFYSKNIPPEGSNSARYSNPEFDRLFEKMATMENGPERLGLIKQMNTILVDDCPVILQAHSVAFTLNQPWIPRISANPLLYGGLKYMVLDASLRAEKQKEWNVAPKWPLYVLGGLLVIAVGGTVMWARNRNV